MRALIAALLLLLACACHADAFGAGNRGFASTAKSVDFLPVNEAYQLQVEILDEHSVHLYWQIAPNYYLYRHRFAFNLRDDNGEIAVQAAMPAGERHSDEYFGEVEIYHTSAEVTLQLQRTTGKATLIATSQGCADAGLCYPPNKQYFKLDFTNGSVTAMAPPRADAKPSTAVGSASQTNGALWYMLLLAALGGAILNLMPCVFPILSLKVLSFARSTNHDRHVHSWLFAAGVVVSFVVVAGVLIALQQAGRAIGWGFQLQSPGFVIALAYLFIVMGLSLSGLVQLGGNFMNTGSSLADRGGMLGSFFTGVMAVVVASPCSAPFMGSALGFAASQPPLISLLVFVSLGAGMAAPLLLFSYSGAARALMPKPGPWMESLKQFLAFPLYATAIWLFWVVGRQTGVNTMTAALAGTLLLALGLWLWNYRWWRRALALGCLVGAAVLGSLHELDTKHATDKALAQGFTVWSDQAVTAQRSAGKPVFVDVTADWCITCMANETAVLHSDDIQQAFAEHGVVYMVADWTNEDPAIAALLRQHGRNGIPLYLMYHPDLAVEPLVLPQILTKDAVLEALQAVSAKKPDVAGNFAQDTRKF
jgi:thiol:disulfide interchange protein DsbD